MSCPQVLGEHISKKSVKESPPLRVVPLFETLSDLEVRATPLRHIAHPLSIKPRLSKQLPVSGSALRGLPHPPRTSLLGV